MICAMFLVYSNLYCSRIGQELNKLHNGLVVNKLSLNINTTNYLVFGKGRATSDMLITINQNVKERVY